MTSKLQEFSYRHKSLIIFILVGAMLLALMFSAGASPGIAVEGFERYSPPHFNLLNRTMPPSGAAGRRHIPDPADFPYFALFQGANVERFSSHTRHELRRVTPVWFMVHSRTPILSGVTFTHIPRVQGGRGSRTGYITMTLPARTGVFPDESPNIWVTRLSGPTLDRSWNNNGFPTANFVFEYPWRAFDRAHSGAVEFDFWHRSCGNLTIPGLAAIPGVFYDYILNCNGGGSGSGGSSGGNQPPPDGGNNGGGDEDCCPDCCDSGCPSCNWEEHPNYCGNPNCPVCNPPCICECDCETGCPDCDGQGGCGCQSACDCLPSCNCQPACNCQSGCFCLDNEYWQNRDPWRPPDRYDWWWEVEPPNNEPPHIPEWTPPPHNNEGQGQVGDTGETGGSWSLPGMGVFDATGEVTTFYEFTADGQQGVHDFQEQWNFQQSEPGSWHPEVNNEWGFERPQINNEWVPQRPGVNNEWIFWRPEENREWIFWRP